MSHAHKWQMLMNLVDDFPSFTELELRHPLSFIPQTIGLADQLANHLVTPDELQAECERIDQGGTDWMAIAARKRRDYCDILRLYIREKRRRRRIDFGDQISFAVEILERFDAVTKELRERWPVVLLDEYQDTNPAQKLMLQRLCPPGSAVTAVGDARQAIYAWRGASMFNLINFTEEFPNEDGAPSRQASLSENFRSGRRIVELANRAISKVPAEHRPGAEIRSVPQNGEGWIGTALFSDQQTEAEFIADEIERLHTEGREWRDLAILIRTRRYMDAIVAVLEDRDIPVEVPELGGLLKIPAVVDTVAWLRVVSDPGPSSNRWAARILMGPRYRIHYRDLVPIARHAVSKTYELTAEVREAFGDREPDPGEIAYSLLEALRDAHDFDDVSGEAKGRIGEFLELVEGLRESVSLPLVELVQRVVEGTGIADALAASTSRTAPAMRENLHAFLGVCSEFAPLEGEANLGAFLEFLDMAEESEDPIPLAITATSDSVKVLTIHKAKGLEFDAVFVPHIASSQEESRWDKGVRMYSVFPDVRLSNPLTSTKQLPPGVRKDVNDLPQFTGKMRPYRDALKKRAEEDERRLFYVAITRARKRLYCTAAHWYASEEEPKGASLFLDEVRAHADLVDTLPGHLDAPTDDSNPVVEAMRSHLVWPPPAFDEGARPWIEQVEAIRAGSLGAEEMLTSASARELYKEHVRTIEALEAERVEEAAVLRPRSLPATSAVKIAEGEISLDTVMNPLPQRPTDAQRLGTEVHSWIEELTRGLTGLAEEEALSEPSLPPDRETVARLKKNFADMGFESRTPFVLESGEPATELPFTLKLGDVLVRGRIDAVYTTGDGTLEIVDFKTGLVPDEPDWRQLELYAEALAALGILKGSARLTYAFLATGEPRSQDYTPQGLGPLTSALAQRSER
jgi:DNA helicase-2/ATP-dependent DNA helicase PcrA